MPHYATKTPRNFANPKSFIVTRVFGPGRTKQEAAVGTRTEAVGIMNDLVEKHPANEAPPMFVVMGGSKMVASHNVSMSMLLGQAA